LFEQKTHNISELISFLESDYPQLEVEWIYSESNLIEYGKDLISSCGMLEAIFNEISKFNGHTNIYLRIHGYKSWIVIRIEGNFMFPEKSPVIIKEADKVNALLNIESEDNSVVIKLAIEIS